MNANYRPHYPWREGEHLFASELNAAFANSAQLFGGTTVRNFGAVGDGVTDDTCALQAAANAVPESGGAVIFPPGVYAVKCPILIGSNTLVYGNGATILAIPGFVADGPLLINRNNAATVITDHDIHVQNMTLDYGSSGAAGASHAVAFLFARNVSVVGCTMQCRGTAGNATAMVGCYNTRVSDCSAFDFRNCGYDHWWGPRFGSVINCYAESALSNQLVNFNPEPTSGSAVGLAAKGFVLANCRFVCTGPNAMPMQIEPLGNQTSLSDVVIEGNVFVNAYLSMRGAVTNAIVANNSFDAAGGGVEVIRFYPYSGGAAPGGITISGNLLISAATVSANIGVIRCNTDSAIISGNLIAGSYSSYAIDTGGFRPVLIGNSWAGPINSLPGGAEYFSSLSLTDGIKFGSQSVTAPGDFSKHIDIWGGVAGVSVTTDGITNYVALGGGAHRFMAGSVSLGFWNAGGFSALGNVHADTATIGSGQVSLTQGTGVPSATQPQGSLYFRTGGGGSVGATLYVSQGGGTWHAVAGV